MILDSNTIIVYVACVVFLFILGKFFILPLKSIAKIIGNSLLGAILIFIINAIGTLLNFHIGLNIGTALITGILGLPRSDITCYIKITTVTLGTPLFVPKWNGWDIPSFFCL